MRLPRPFYRLPRCFDAARLAAAVAALPPAAWAPHPNRLPGNAAVRPITVDGAENDDVHGAMLPTLHLQALPYTRQVLASFGVAWSRSRLLRLAPGAMVPRHSDINHHWFYRARVHVPIVTTPHVRFHCGHASVHMAAGEAWVFDNWRPTTSRTTDRSRASISSPTPPAMRHSGTRSAVPTPAQGRRPGWTSIRRRRRP